MSQYPVVVEELLSRYPDRPMIHITQQVEEPARKDGIQYGSLMIPVDSEKHLVLITHTYELIGIKAKDWTIPGGKIEATESFEAAAIRETIEETGMRCEILGLFKLFHFTHLNQDEKIAEWYVPAFLGAVVGENVCNNTKEISEIGRFIELPDGFAGELNQYYNDLMKFVEKKTMNYIFP